jgi:hypothetical protein
VDEALTRYQAALSRTAKAAQFAGFTLSESTPQARQPSGRGRGLRVTPPPGPGLGAVTPHAEAAVVVGAASPRTRAEIAPRRDANLPSPNAEGATSPLSTLGPCLMEGAPRAQAAPRFATPRKHRATSASPRCVLHGYGGRIQQFAARRLGCLSWRPLNATGPRCAGHEARLAHPRCVRHFGSQAPGSSPTATRSPTMTGNSGYPSLSRAGRGDADLNAPAHRRA